MLETLSSLQALPTPQVNAATARARRIRFMSPGTASGRSRPGPIAEDAQRPQRDQRQPGHGQQRVGDVGGIVDQPRTGHDEEGGPERSRPAGRATRASPRRPTSAATPKMAQAQVAMAAPTWSTKNSINPTVVAGASDPDAVIAAW